MSEDPDMDCKYCKSPLYWTGFEFEPCDCYAAENEHLRAENREMLEALQEIAKYDDIRTPDGICPYGCDCPHIAKEAIKKARGE